MFDINLGLTVWTSVVFFALLFILQRYAWEPILGAVDAREKRIQDSLDRAAGERKEASALLEEHRQQMADARLRAQELIGEGRAAGETLRQEIEGKARAEGLALIERAREAIEREKESAIQALRKESVDLALAAAARLMQEQLDQEKDRELIVGYVEYLAEGREEARA